MIMIQLNVFIFLCHFCSNCSHPCMFFSMRTILSRVTISIHYTRLVHWSDDGLWHSPKRHHLHNEVFIKRILKFFTVVKASIFIHLSYITDHQSCFPIYSVLAEITLLQHKDFIKKIAAHIFLKASPWILICVAICAMQFFWQFRALHKVINYTLPD